jgi:hypothetical protein
MDISSNLRSTAFSSFDMLSLPLALSGDSMLFYQYLTPIEIGTYSLRIGESTPVLLSTSKVDIESIVELDF